MTPFPPSSPLQDVLKYRYYAQLLSSSPKTFGQDSLFEATYLDVAGFTGAFVTVQPFDGSQVSMTWLGAPTNDSESDDFWYQVQFPNVIFLGGAVGVLADIVIFLILNNSRHRE